MVEQIYGPRSKEGICTKIALDMRGIFELLTISYLQLHS